MTGVGVADGTEFWPLAHRSGLDDMNILDDTRVGSSYDVEKVFITSWLFNKLLKIEAGKNIVSELSMGWVDPRIGLV